MAKTFRAGVIGCGSIAQHCHIPGYLKTPACQVVAACDPGEAQREAAQKLVPGLKVYPTYQKMLQEHELDVVSVCTPNYLHAEHTIAALKAGANVILEKPAALSMDEIDAMKRARKQADRTVIVGFSHRFMAGPRKAKKVLEKGTLGAPFMIRIRLAHTGPYPGWAQGDWFYKPKEAGGGAMLDMGIHAIDLCRWLLGPIRSVVAQVGTLRKDIKVDDNAVMALEFKAKALGYIEIGWTSPAGFTGIEIFCDTGAITIDYGHAMTVTSGRTTPDLKAGGKLETRVVEEHPTAGGWAIEIAEMVKAIKKGEDLDLGLDTGGAALAVALGAYESSRTGQRVKL